ncbi:hypothetical protein BaRGS_00029872, partial [Batillaria attramentaria]
RCSPTWHCPTGRTTSKHHDPNQRTSTKTPEMDWYRAAVVEAVSREADTGGVVLLGTRGQGVPASPTLGELDWALLREGLLEYRDPTASAPVLSICHGFSDTELALLSKRSPAFVNKEASVHEDPGLQKVVEEVGGELFQAEPLIDGLPASVWLECVEPTLSILVSLNALRHRRSNLSLKKGVPEILDSNRSRHGDFEFGPIAIFHHPGRIQQMMLLRFEYLNAVNNDPDLGDINQSAEQNRRSLNRHRRHRDMQRLENEVVRHTAVPLMTQHDDAASTRHHTAGCRHTHVNNQQAKVEQLDWNCNCNSVGDGGGSETGGGGAVGALVAATSAVLVSIPGQDVTSHVPETSGHVTGSPGGDNLRSHISFPTSTASFGGQRLAPPRELDVMALGDHAMWAAVPTTRRCPPTYFLPSAAFPRERHVTITTHNPASSRHLWNVSRNLVRRARGVWSRWKSRLERSVTSRDKHRVRRGG